MLRPTADAAVLQADLEALVGGENGRAALAACQAAVWGAQNRPLVRRWPCKGERRRAANAPVSTPAGATAYEDAYGQLVRELRDEPPPPLEAPAVPAAQLHAECDDASMPISPMIPLLRPNLRSESIKYALQQRHFTCH